ncbi:hypothetical protein [Streptomyces collinus]|uniref:hypothetical protein n=1 Tax=Streptomyces collinus TaxID=42684 RepID=UPI0036D0DE89
MSRATSTPTSTTSARETEDAIVGAFTGSPTAPRTLLLGRYDTDGRLRYIGRSTTLPQTAGRTVAGLLTPGRERPPLDGLDVLRRMGLA